MIRADGSMYFCSPSRLFVSSVGHLASPFSRCTADHQTTSPARRPLAFAPYPDGSSSHKVSSMPSSMVLSNGSKSSRDLARGRWAVDGSMLTISTKRVVRKRVRRGHLSPQNGSRGNGTNSFQNGAIGSALRAMNLRRSIPNGTGSNTPRGMGSFSNTQTNTQLGTQSVSGQQTRSVHNDDRFPRILQELKMEGETPRKGSVTTISGDSGGTQVEKR